MSDAIQFGFGWLTLVLALTVIGLATGEQVNLYGLLGLVLGGVALIVKGALSGAVLTNSGGSGDGGGSE